MQEQDYIAANRELWENWTASHLRSAFYDLAGFKAGRNSLLPVEIAEVGDVAGKSLLHLQCHFGQDTLSWARLGATVTGADFSEQAIAAARDLATELHIPASFVCANLYDLPDVLAGEFDLVYTGGGALWWLPDLTRWAAVVARYLKSGGSFYLHEIHPFPMAFEEVAGELKPTHPYFHADSPLRFETQGSYAGSSDYQGVEYGWAHSLAEIISALLAAGLRLQFLHESPYAYYQMFPSLVQEGAGRWAMLKHELPLSFSLLATK